MTEDRERQEGQEVIQGGAQKKLGAGSEQKLQVHKVREGSAVGSSGELPWGRTLMCARFKAAVEAAARSCCVYLRLPRNRLSRLARGAGQGASAARWYGKGINIKGPACSFTGKAHQ